MSITYFNSASVRTTSTYQNLINDLNAQGGDWLQTASTVYSDPSDPTSNVVTLSVTDNITIDMDTSGSTPLLRVNHSLGLNANVAAHANMYSTYKIAVTDKGLTCASTVSSNASYRFRLTIGNVTDSRGRSSRGVLLTKGGSASGYMTYVFTDNMTALISYPHQIFANQSEQYEQYIKAFSPSCEDVFDDILIPIFKWTEAIGEGTVNGQKYYITNTAVIPYT